MLPIHADPAEVHENLMSGYAAFTETLAASGALVSANQLQSADIATTVSVHNGKRLFSDGPFIGDDGGARRLLPGGYYLLESDTLDEAISWAAGIPGARYGHVEVRPVVMRQPEIGA